MVCGAVPPARVVACLSEQRLAHCVPSQLTGVVSAHSLLCLARSSATPTRLICSAYPSGDGGLVIKSGPPPEFCDCVPYPSSCQRSSLWVSGVRVRDKRDSPVAANLARAKLRVNSATDEAGTPPGRHPPAEYGVDTSRLDLEVALSVAAALAERLAPSDNPSRGASALPW